MSTLSVPKPLAAILAAALVLGGCGGCGKKKKGKKKGNKAAQTEGAAPAPQVPAKDTVTAVVYTAKDRAMVWMETRPGTLGVDPARGAWTGEGFILAENDAWHHYLVDGTSFSTMQGPDADDKVLTDVLQLQTQAPQGYSWEMDLAPNGFHRVFVNPALGKKQRLGMYPDPPSSPVWLEGTRPAKLGAEFPPLTKAAGWQAREDGSYQNLPPTGSAPVTAPDAPPEKITAWTDTLTKVRAAPVQVHLTRTANLDRDPENEGFICVTGGRGSPCYVVDTVGGQDRFFATTLQWAEGPPEDVPQFFTTEQGTYLMHSPRGSVTARGTGLIRIVRFDGIGYTTEVVQ